MAELLGASVRRGVADGRGSSERWRRLCSGVLGSEGEARQRAGWGQVRGWVDPYGNGVVIRGIALASEGQAGSCMPAHAGAVLGLASASRQRLKTGMPLVGWAAG